jgi:peroxiredoxin
VYRVRPTRRTVVGRRSRSGTSLEGSTAPDFTLRNTVGAEVTRAYAGVHAEYGRHTRAGTFPVDPTGTVRHEHLADHSTDRRYADFFGYLIDDDSEDEYFA